MNRDNLHAWMQRPVCECCQSDAGIDYYVVDGRTDAAPLCGKCFEEITAEQEEGEPGLTGERKTRKEEGK